MTDMLSSLYIFATYSNNYRYYLFFSALWNLDLCSVVLPQLKSLLSSNYERYAADNNNRYFNFIVYLFIYLFFLLLLMFYL